VEIDKTNLQVYAAINAVIFKIYVNLLSEFKKFKETRWSVVRLG
jgi:hypothetical protein